MKDLRNNGRSLNRRQQTNNNNNNYNKKGQSLKRTQYKQLG